MRKGIFINKKTGKIEERFFAYVNFPSAYRVYDDVGVFPDGNEEDFILLKVFY